MLTVVSSFKVHDLERQLVKSTNIFTAGILSEMRVSSHIYITAVPLIFLFHINISDLYQFST